VPCLYYGDEVGAEGAPGGPDGDLAMRRAVDLPAALADPDAMAGRACRVWGREFGG